MAEIVCFFPGKEGIGVILALDKKELEKLEKRLKSKTLNVEYGFDFGLQVPFIKIDDVLIYLPALILEGLYYNPRLYVYSIVTDKISMYIGTVELDPIRIIRLDSVGKASSEFFNVLVPLISVKSNILPSVEFEDEKNEKIDMTKGDIT